MGTPDRKYNLLFQLKCLLFSTASIHLNFGVHQSCNAFLNDQCHINPRFYQRKNICPAFADDFGKAIKLKLGGALMEELKY